MQTQEALHLVIERKGLDAQIIDRDLMPREHVDRLAYRAVAAADAHDADLVVPGADDLGFWHVARRGREFAPETVEHELILGRVLGIGAVLIVAGAAGEVGALWVHAGQGAVRNGVVVAVHVAVELVETRELLGG